MLGAHGSLPVIPAPKGRQGSPLQGSYSTELWVWLKKPHPDKNRLDSTYIHGKKKTETSHVHDSCSSPHFTPLCVCCSWSVVDRHRPQKFHCIWGHLRCLYEDLGRWLGQEMACFANMRTWSPSLGSKQTKAECGIHPCNPKSREADTGGSQA